MSNQTYQTGSNVQIKHSICKTTEQILNKCTLYFILQYDKNTKHIINVKYNNLQYSFHWKYTICFKCNADFKLYN